MNGMTPILADSGGVGQGAIDTAFKAAMCCPVLLSLRQTPAQIFVRS